MTNKIEEGILKTLIYFDIFDFPLTIFEIWKYFYSPSPFAGFWRINSLQKISNRKITSFKIKETLEKGKVLNNFIESRNGFYFLKGRGDIIKTRLERYNLAARKFKKVRRIGKILALIPFIKLITVCNRLGYSNANDESDIDFFIVTTRRRTWTARFLSVLILKFLGLRPRKGRIKDKICLSFFISEEKLNLEDLTLKPEDIYFNYWLNQLVPVYETENIYLRFIEKNQWIKQFLPNSIVYKVNWRRQVELGFLGKAAKRLGEIICSFFSETILKKIQLYILPANLKRLANLDTRVVITDRVLKFHANDRREEFIKIFKEKIKKYEDTRKDN